MTRGSVQRGVQPVPQWRDPSHEYLEFWVGDGSTEREGHGPGVPPGVMTNEEAMQRSVGIADHEEDGMNNSYYQYFLPGFQGTLQNYLVELFRQYDDFALELFMQSNHMGNPPNWRRMTEPARYLYEHFNWWVTEAISLFNKHDQMCKHSHKHWSLHHHTVPTHVCNHTGWGHGGDQEPWSQEDQ